MGLRLGQTKPASSPVGLRHKKATGVCSRGLGEKAAGGGPYRSPGVSDVRKGTLRTLLGALALKWLVVLRKHMTPAALSIANVFLSKGQSSLSNSSSRQEPEQYSGLSFH